MNLNRENKANKLSASFMEAIRRHICYYESIGIVKGVILRSFDQTTFSMGTDYKSIEVAIKSENMEGVHYQLDRLQAFAEFMASTNLAMPTNINGYLTNSAASIFTQLPFVYGGENLKLQFNEIDMQSPLLGGVSHTLSRLPNGIGTYLALTGNVLQGKDLLPLGFVKTFALLEYENYEHIKRRSPRNYNVEIYEDQFRHNYGHQLNKIVDIDETVKEYFDRIETQNPRNVLFDLYYRRKIIEHANIQFRRDLTNPEQWLQESQQRAAGVGNYLLKYEAEILNDLPEVHSEERVSFTAEEADVIAYAFCSNELQEILNRLQHHGSPTADRLYSTLSQKNPYVLEVILRQLRAAESMSFGEALKMEYATAIALAEHPKASQWAFTWLKPEQRDALQGVNFGKLKKFGAKMVQKGDQYLDTTFARIPKAFLPAKKYYHIMPEAFRCYFNSQALRRPEANRNYRDVVKTMLIEYGIDHLNPSFDKFTALEKLRHFFRFREKNEAKARRMMELITSKTARDEYFQQRVEEIRKFATSPESAKRLESIIAQAFEDELENKEKFLTSRFKSLLRLDNAPEIERLKKTIVHRISDEFMAPTDRKEEDYEGMFNLPMEIGFDRFTLSERGKALSHLDELRDSYTRETLIKNKKDLKALYRRMLPPDTPLFDAHKTADYHFLWDKNHIFYGAREQESHFEITGGHRSMARIAVGKTPPLAKKFRTAFLSLVAKALTENEVKFTPEMKSEVLEIFTKELVLDYKEYAFDIPRLWKLDQTEFLHFMKFLRPEVAKADLEKYLIKSKLVQLKTLNHKTSQPGAALPTQEQIAAVRELNEVQTGRGPAIPTVVRADLDSLKELLTNNEVLSPEMIGQLQTFFSYRDHPFVAQMEEDLTEIYRTKFIDVFRADEIHFTESGKKATEDNIFSQTFAREMRNEFVAFMVPHLMFNLSNRTIARLDQLYERLADYLGELAEDDPLRPKKKKADGTFVETPSGIPDKKVVAAMLKRSGFKTESEEEVDGVLDLTDRILNLMIEVNQSFRDRLNMREDMLKVISDDLRLVLRLKLLLISNNVLIKNLGEKAIEKDAERIARAYTEEEMQTLKELAWPEDAEKSFEGVVPEDEVESLPSSILRLGIVKKHLGHPYERWLAHVNHEDMLKQGGFFDPTDSSDTDVGERPSQIPTGRNTEKFFEYLTPVENNILNRLTTYADTLREFLRTHKLSLEHAPDARSAVEHFFPEVNDPESSEFSRQGQIRNLLAGQRQYPLNMDPFIRGYTSATSTLRKDFQKIRDAAHISYFSDLVQKVGSVSNAMQLGVHSTTIGSHQYDKNTLRWTTIRRRLGDGLEFVEELSTQDPDRALAPGNFGTIKKMENLSRAYFQGQKSGAFESFYYQLNDENTSTPDNFGELDQRQSPSEWLDYEVYKFCVAAFTAESEGRSSMPLKLSTSSIASFFTPSYFRDHLLRKLYTEMFTLERCNETLENGKISEPHIVATSMRQDPRLLDWKRALDNELPVKKYLAFETFAYRGYGGTVTARAKKNDYFEQLNEQIFDFNAEKAQPAEIPEIIRKEKPEPFQMERFYEEVVNSVAEAERPGTDALKTELAESLTTVSKRLKLYH